MLQSNRWLLLVAVAGTLVSAGLAKTDALRAQAPSRVLVVPPSKTMVHLAIDLPEGLDIDPAQPWQLVEVGKPQVAVAAQLLGAIAVDGSPAQGQRRLAASIAPKDVDDRARRFRLQPAPADATENGPAFHFEEVTDKSLRLSDGGAPVFTYNHGIITDRAVPETDPRRSRGCYVHPVWGLGGEVLTEDFPRDHYHHHGISWTWPHVQIDGREYDLWADRGIRQQFVRWLDRQTGPVAATLGVENGWFIGDEKVMIERVWLRAYHVSGDSRALDLEFAWIPVEKPITLWGAPGKSYGGLTVRFAPPSRSDESTVIIVPAGPTAEDLKETPLPWADFASRFGENSGTSGAAVFVDPAHPDYPPTWLTRHYGPLCVGWPGVNSKTFPPGEPIRLNYRVWIHKTALPAEDIQLAYEGYTAAMCAKWK